MCRRLVRPILLVTLSAIALTALAACNTVKGFGRDVQEVGEAGQRALNPD